MVGDAEDAATLQEATDWGSWTSTSWTPTSWTPTAWTPTAWTPTASSPTAWSTAAEDADDGVYESGPGLQANASLGQSRAAPDDPVLYAIQLWFMPVLVTLGTLGNCLCVVVFFGTKLKKLSSSYYLSALAISDTCCLVAVGATWLQLIDIPSFNKNGFCQIFVYTKQLCSFLSVWFVVAFTVERFVAVSYPLQRLSMCTVARARTILGSLVVVGMSINSPYLYMAAIVPTEVPAELAAPDAPSASASTTASATASALVRRPNVTTINICGMHEHWRNLANMLNYADVILTLILPVFLILTLNACIARTVWRLARARRALTNQNTQHMQCPQIVLNGSMRGRRTVRRATHHRGSTRPGGTQSKVTEMLLVVSTVFIALNLPSYIVRLWVFVSEEKDADSLAHMTILQGYSNVLFDTNFGINFVLYCVSGQNFRRALFGMCGLRSRRTDATMLTVVSEVARAGSLNRHRGNNVTSFRFIRDQRAGSQELERLESLALAKDQEGNGYHSEKTRL